MGTEYKDDEIIKINKKLKDGENLTEDESEYYRSYLEIFLPNLEKTDAGKAKILNLLNNTFDDLKKYGELTAGSLYKMGFSLNEIEFFGSDMFLKILANFNEDKVDKDTAKMVKEAKKTLKAKNEMKTKIAEAVKKEKNK
jgi:hypothetical protein